MNRQINMNPMEELELLAKWRGFLEGRAISLDERVSSSKRRTPCERPAIIDEHIEEVRAALNAHQTLARLCQQNAQGRAYARLLEQHFVVSGEEARKRASRAVGGIAGALRRKKLEMRLEAALTAYRALQATSSAREGAGVRGS